MAELFISYSSEDRPAAVLLADSLKRLALDVWYDKSLKPRQRWRVKIGDALSDARIVIAIWSASARTSKWVLHEADVAERTDRLLSLFIDNSEIPPPFSEDQALNFVNWNGDPEADCYLELIEAIGERLQRAELVEYAIFRRIQKSNPTANSKRRLRHYTYRDMLALCDEVRDHVRTFDPDVMFCFDSRGGIWAEMFFDRLTNRIPVIVGFRLKSSGPRKSDLVFNDCHLIQTPRWSLYVPPLLTSLPRSTKILFVDDYSHTGETCARVRSYLVDELGWNASAVRTLTLVTSPEAMENGQGPDIFGVKETAEIVDLFYMFRR